MKTEKIAVTLKKSLCKRTKKQKACVAALGLRRMHQTVILPDIAAVRGAINAVNFMLSVEAVSE